jgi:hypothetical protein
LHFILSQKDQTGRSDLETIGTYVLDYQTSNDPVINNSLRSSPGDIGGASAKVREKSDQGIGYRHMSPINRRFWNKINGLINDALQRDTNTTIKINSSE